MKVFIVAGNAKQAMEYSMRTGLDHKEGIYVSRPEVMRGVRDHSYIRVGTWFERKDLAQIDRIIDANRFHEL